MNKGKSKGLSDRALHVIEGRARLTREGLKWFGSTIAFSRVGDKGKDHNLKNKTKKKKQKTNVVASLLCDTRGRPGLHLNPASASLTKMWSLRSYIINVSQMAQGFLHLFCLALISNLSVIS